MIRKPAFTLLEIVVTLAVLSVLGGFATFMIVQGNQQLAYTVELERAIRLGELYMEEVLATGRWDERSFRERDWDDVIPFHLASLGPEENSRSLYDDYDDYDGFTAMQSHQTKDGQELGAEFSTYRVHIQVRFLEYGSFRPSLRPADLKQIRVRVEWRDSQSIELTTIAANV